MPELPEVEIYKENFKAKGLNKEIDHVEVLDKGILDKTDEKQLNSFLKNHKFKNAERIGKYLCLELENSKCLEVHFGMTGHFEFLSNGSLPKSSRALLYFKNGETLAYVDRRKIGHFALADSLDAIVKEHKLGPDALDFNTEEIIQKLKSTRAKIKSALMDQSIISGIGNVYADEILFQAKIHPESVSGALSLEHSQKIISKIKEVLEVSIEFIRGSESSYQKARKSLPENYLLPVRKEGADCPGDCKGKVSMIKVGGRSTYFCEKCQELVK